MTQLVPNIAINLTNLKIDNLKGFRDQEDWGRWTLGKTTSVDLQTNKSGWIEARIDLSLPYPKQHLEILLNGNSIQKLDSPDRSISFSIRLPLNLIDGDNQLQLITDKSNMDPSLVPFAPLDRTDMAIRLHRLDFSPLHVMTKQSHGQLYYVSQPKYLSTYQNAPGRNAGIFFQLPGPKILNYRLLRASDSQAFDFQIDGHSVYQSQQGSRGTLAVGKLPLQTDGQLHRLEVISHTGTAREITPDDSIKTLEKVNGPFTFYIQELSLTPRASWEHLVLPLAIIGTFLCIALLALLLFRSDPNSSSEGKFQ